MSNFDKDKGLSLAGYFKKAVKEKDWLTLLTLALGIINIPLALSGFTNGIFSAFFGFVVAFVAMLALDKTRNSVAIAGAICGFSGTAIGIIYVCMTYLPDIPA